MSVREHGNETGNGISLSEMGLVHGEGVAFESNPHKFSPRQLLAYLILAIFVAEMIIMKVLHTAVQDLPPVTEAIVDATALILLVFPVLFASLLRPMNRTIDQLKRQQETLESCKQAIDQTARSVIIADTGGTIE